MRHINNFKVKMPNFYWKNLRKFASYHKKESQQWNPVVGLEIHAQINTESKLFSGASTGFDKPVNSCVAFFDCATPGTLPVINKKCVESGILTALALSCELNEVSLFDRKHYFYADLPAGYQITQQRQPLAVGGKLQFNVFAPGVHKQPYMKACKIKQIQLEQDSGRSLHDNLRNRSLIDLNRAGMPLMEFVLEPELSDGYEAAALVKELIMILRKLNACSCKMEEGALRIDANISVHKPTEPLGVRTEVKNIGSIRALAAAIHYEISRQIKMLDKGEKIINETLSWDSESQKTVSMRDKEKMQDYRFMPEPNLPPLRLHMKCDKINTLNLVDVNEIYKRLPELPEQTRENLIKNHGLPILIVMALVNNNILIQLFYDIMNENNTRKSRRVANILLMDLLQFVNKNKLNLETLQISSKQIGAVVDLLESQTINAHVVQDVLRHLVDNPKKMPIEIVTDLQLTQINDTEELTKLCQAVLDNNPKAVAKYKHGKIKILHALSNMVAKETANRANMTKVSKIMHELMN